MPLRPKKPCAHPERCPLLVPAGQRLCPEHQRQANYQYNHQQRPASHSFYGTYEWKKLRKECLRRYPNCVDCGAPSTQADHIISRSQGGPDTQDNLVGRCGPCHSRKTALNDARWG